MEIILVALVALIASVLTFFTGFGLGTLLTPAFMVFFPVDIAIGLTAVVHLLNNLFKLLLVGKNADKSVLLKFGIPAIIFSFAGAYLLTLIPEREPLLVHHWFGGYYPVYSIKLIIAILLLIFSIMDIAPAMKKVNISSKFIPIGGALSGFFGGLSGHQGALRSAFLIKSGLTKEAFIGTTVILSCFVDITRLTVYGSKLTTDILSENILWIISATLAAFLGAYIGNKIFKKAPIKFIENIVATALICYAIAMLLGIA
jgi:uncharacterized membrane protein YfcA